MVSEYSRKNKVIFLKNHLTNPGERYIIYVSEKLNNKYLFRGGVKFPTGGEDACVRSPRPGCVKEQRGAVLRVRLNR